MVYVEVKYAFWITRNQRKKVLIKEAQINGWNKDQIDGSIEAKENPFKVIKRHRWILAKTYEEMKNNKN